MSVSSTTASLTFTGNNSTSTAYALTGLRFDASSWLDVATISSAGVVTTLTLGTHYTLGGDGSAGTGTLTSTSGNAIPASATLRVRRNTPLTQGLDLVNGTAPDQPSLEAALDRLTLALQDASRRDTLLEARALRAADADTVAGTLPLTAQRASRYLAFDASGNPVVGPLTEDSAAERAESAASLVHISGLLTVFADFTASAATHFGKLITAATVDPCLITLPVVTAATYGRFALDTFAQGFEFTGDFLNGPGGTMSAIPAFSGIWTIEAIAGKWVATGSIIDPAAAIDDSTATTVTDLRTDFNALLASLRTAGILLEA